MTASWSKMEQRIKADRRHVTNCIFFQASVSVHLNISEANNGQNHQQPRPQAKAEVIAQREQVRMLGIALGNWREAARQCGLSEGRVLNWVVRYGWKLPMHGSVHLSEEL